MQWLVDAAARAVERRPGTVLLALLLLTLALGGAGTRLEMETDIAEFGAEAGLAAVFEEIEETFGAGSGRLQVVVDAGRGGDVLTPEGLEAALRVEEIAEEELERWLVDASPTSPAVVSYAGLLLEQVQGLDLEVGEMTDPFVSALVTDALAREGGAQLRSVLSDDLDPDEGSARAGLVSVRLDPDLSERVQANAGLALREALDAEDLGWIDAEPFSLPLLSQELETNMLAELPVLLAISVVLIVFVLLALFRRVGDVLLTLGGMAVTLVWFAGLSALLGPGFLGLTGEFSQIAIAVPVMLIGLGVDYSVHLVSRYREERAEDRGPAPSSGRAIRTVGVALMLVTVTTMVGFLANVRSPLPPIADFGIFTAVGMFAAFVVMGLLVPSARQLLDRRSSRPPGPVPGGSGDTRLGRAVAGVVDLALRRPVTVIGAAAVLAVAGTLAAADIDTEFSQEDFVPEDTRAADLLHRMEVLFGAVVTEQTYVVVEADMTEPDVAERLRGARERLAGIEDVQTVEGEADVTSPLTVPDQVVRSAQMVRTLLVEQARVAVGEASPDEALPLPDALAPEDLPDATGDELGEVDDALGGPDPGAPDDAADLDEDEIRDRLPPGEELQDALLTLLGEEELARRLAARVGAEARDEQLASLGVETAEQLAAMAPDDVDLATLDAIDFPLEELGEDARELLAAAEDLESLGWSPDTSPRGTDLDAVYDRTAGIVGGELGRTLAPDRRSGLLIIATTAGEEGAQPLRDEILDALAPLAEFADLAVVSEQLVIQETLDMLVAAQVEKILFSLGAAFTLLVLYYLVSRRRPMLGVITMVPTLLAVPLVLGVMWLVGLPFNALTATIASIAVGFGVDYGIHLSNRFREEAARAPDPESAVRETVVHTGAALTGSAVTTALAFGVMVISGLLPLRQFGAITAITMAVALGSTLLVQSSCLLLWERLHRRRASAGSRDAPAGSRHTSAGSRGAPTEART